MSKSTYIPRRQAHRDANHKEIQDALVKIERPVFDLCGVGKKMPDILTRHVDGHLVLLELKVKDGVASAGQLKFAREWGINNVKLVRTVYEAYQAVGYFV